MRNAAVFIEDPLRKGPQVRDRDHSETGAEGEPLGNARGQADAGEGARTAAERDCLDLPQADPGFTEKLIDHRQDPLRMAARELRLPGQQPAFDEQRGRAALGGRVERQHLHGATARRHGVAAGGA